MTLAATRLGYQGKCNAKSWLEYDSWWNRLDEDLKGNGGRKWSFVNEYWF